MSGGTLLLQFTGLGGGRYAREPVEVHRDQTPRRKEWVTHNHGDPDQDGDLDVLLPTVGGGEDGFQGQTDEIAWNDGSWGESSVLDNGAGTSTLVGVFTDRDGDQRQDVFIPGDLGPPSAFFLNGGPDGQGRPTLRDEAPALGADVTMSAMGIDSADLNGDGLLDYCMTDLGPPRCLQSDASGVYLEPGASLGLVPTTWVQGVGTVGWSLDFADFDADGHLDAAQSGGPFPNEDEGVFFFDWPDLLWMGNSAGGFDDVTDQSSVGSLENHVGLVTADFDGDGFLDLVFAGPLNPPELHMNRCNESSWLMVELAGPAGNTEGIGAQVELRATDLRQTREVQTLRGVSQGPSSVHFGLGERENVDTLMVRWPDGETSAFEDLPTRRRVTIAHPSRVE